MQSRAWRVLYRPMPLRMSARPTGWLGTLRSSGASSGFSPMGFNTLYHRPEKYSLLAQGRALASLIMIIDDNYANLNATTQNDPILA